VFAAAAIVTVAWSGSMGAGMPMPGDWIMSMAWMRMPGQSWPGAAAMFVAMWAVMMTAMMLPSLMPVLLHHRRPVRVACAYLATWTAAGAVVYPIGIAIAAAEMRWPALSRAVPMLVGAVLVAAGALQLTRWKRRELAHCRDRSCCALGRRPGPRQAWSDGFRIGRHCVACCAGPMVVLLAAGVMDVWVMAAVTLAITVERLAPRPRFTARALGVAALVVGGVMIAVAP
jgi:predicted metal-binding membrane protein